MSVQLVRQYYSQVEKIIRYGGTRKETAVRKPFHDLLEQYARQKNLELIGELDYRTGKGHTIMPDGTLKDAAAPDALLTRFVSYESPEVREVLG